MGTVKICPNCGSTNVSLTSETNRFESMNKDLHYYCSDCNFEGLMPEVEKGDIKEFRKKLKSKETLKPKISKEKDEPLWKKILVVLFIICTGIIPGLIIVVLYNKLKKREAVETHEGEIDDDKLYETLKEANK